MAFESILVFLLVPILIWAFRTFDNLMKHEYEQFHNQWIEDGKPSGIYWRPRECHPSFQGVMATQRSMIKILFRKPDWAASSVYASRLIRRYRILVLIWNIYFFFWLTVRKGLP